MSLSTIVYLDNSLLFLASLRAVYSVHYYFYVIKAIAIYTHITSSDQREITENSMNSTLEKIFSDRNSSGDETWKYCNHAIT